MRSSVHALCRAARWVALGALGATSCGSDAPEDLTEMKAVVRDRFPDAPQISTADLAAWLADETLPQPILLDVRTATEFEISHLRGAHLAGDVQAAQRVLEGANKDAAIIAYCSVGYRSSQLVERLRAAGFSNVSSLEGSIFQWANEGRAVYRDDVRVEFVHPFDDEWGRLLKPSLRAPPPR
jgi:rhodanese-related sulfurtransferase